MTDKTTAAADLKAYHNAVPNSTFIMPDGRVLRFSGHTYHTNDVAEQKELDAIAGTCGIGKGVVVKATEQQALLDKAATALSTQAANAQKAEQEALLKRGGSVAG